MKKHTVHIIFCMLCLISVSSTYCLSQNTQENVKVLEALIAEEDFQVAQDSLNGYINFYDTTNQKDSLYAFPYYVGKIKTATSSSSLGVSEAENFLETIVKDITEPKIVSDAYINISMFYDDLGEYQKSFDATKTALNFIEKSTIATPSEKGKVIYNLGVTAQTMGNMDEAKKHFKTARTLYEGFPKTKKSLLSKVYNATGAMYYLSSKLDSAEIFFEKAAYSLEKAEGDPLDNIYNATVIKSNVMLVQYIQGNPSKAIKTLEQVVINYNKVIKETKDENTRVKARKNIGTALGNLAVIYNEMGNVIRAGEILEYTYEQQLKTLQPADPKVVTLKIQMAQNQISQHNLDKAITLLTEARMVWEKTPNHSNYWKAAGYYALAEAHKQKGDIADAELYYNKAEPLFEASLKNEYDAEFLGFLRNKALFLSEKGENNEALTTAFKGLDYVKNNNETYSILPIKEIENISSIYTNFEDFANAQLWAKKGLKLLDDGIKISKTSIDSVQVEFKKPTLLLYEAKAAYMLNVQKDVPFLKETLIKLEQATKVLERRKSVSFSPESINILLQEYKILTDFAKEIQVQLYEKTGDLNYLNDIVSLHESSLYNRIRSRLNLQQDILFSNVPSTILERENYLKEKLSNSLTEQDTTKTAVKKYIHASENFELFLDSLKANFPKYYQMRYATIAQSLVSVQNNIPENTTVIRYLFISEMLYAFIINKEKKHWVPLPFSETDTEITNLNEAVFNEKETTELLFQLYQKLWEPLAPFIKTKKVIVIPDGQLYNLSFESLTTEKAANYQELIGKSLLKKHLFSYHFSLLLVKNETAPAAKKLYKSEFIAFAPEFTGSMKDAYTSTINDSLNLDKTYLKLLPQPFSKQLIKKYTQNFKGASYLNQAAQKNTFVANAGEHKIIHIGTHAESNNIQPALSRLIFAKNLEQDSLTNNNSLYTYEIYNHDLNADLTVLTACETGKPTYQSGEGMISLSHAFTYAGSKSILTSLWKIDEQASAEIVGYFYDNLKDGLEKDKALQQAKLKYLATAKGRTAAPQYWAGLVLIGDTSAIEIEGGIPIWIWVLGGLLLLIVLFYFLRRRK